MRIALRCLIALNWIGVGLACNLLYINYMAWYGFCEDLAKHDADAKFPGGVIDDSQPGAQRITNEIGYRYLQERATMYRQQLKSPTQAGQWASGAMIAVGTVTALGLIGIFPKKAQPATP